MIDAALIERCADPSLPPAVVEQFVATAGSEDPLAITVKAGGRLVLVPKPRTPEEVLDVMRQYVGKASVRVGITQFPAGVGVAEINQLDAGLADACENLKQGTALFARVARIVTKWYGSPTSQEVFPQLFEDAVYAWRTGEFEGTKVFQAPDPGGATFLREKVLRVEPATLGEQEPDKNENADADAEPEAETDKTTGSAEMRIDLSRIGGN